MGPEAKKCNVISVTGRDRRFRIVSGPRHLRKSQIMIFLLLLALSAAPARAAVPAEMVAASTPSAVATSTSPSAARGAQIYGTMCAVCHGAAGEGYKADRAPMLANSDLLASASDYFLRLAVEEGRPGTTMSAWSGARRGPLTPGDVDALVNFIRGWQKSPPAQLDERPAAGSAKRGAKIFSARCLSCHGQNGVGGQNLQIGSAQFLLGAGDGFLRRVIGKGLEGTAMRGFEDSLGAKGIDDLLALMRGWSSGSAVRLAPASPAPIPLGHVPLNPNGPAAEGFFAYPASTPADAVKTQLDRGAKMTLIDARPPADYVNEHIAGAVSVPFYDPAPYLSGLPRDSWLVAYCACPHAESGTLAKKLLEAGFSKVTTIDEGLPYWKTRKYGVRAGLAP